MEYSEPFEIFTSLRYDTALSSYGGGRVSPGNYNDEEFYLPQYHFDRLAESIQNFQLDNVTSQLKDYGSFVHHLCEEVLAHKKKHNGAEGPLKLRVSMSKDGDLHTTIGPIPPASMELLLPVAFDWKSSEVQQKLSENRFWKIFLDTQPTPSTDFTSYKTNRRYMYDAARSRSLPEGTTMSSAVEVVMYNMEGDITEGSLTSLYFLREGRWVTPPSSTGCQRGTTRRWALKEGLCIEESVKPNSLKDGETVIVSNGARGFNLGKMTL